MKKIQKKPARVTRCKRGSSKIHKKYGTRSVAATRMANTRAQKAAHKKNKQIKLTDFNASKRFMEKEKEEDNKLQAQAKLGLSRK